MARKKWLNLPKKVKPKRNNLEAVIQTQFFTWLTHEMPAIRKVSYHIPNGAKRHPAVALELKSQGLTPGVLDVFIACPSKGYHGLYIEFKAGKNKLTKEQAEFKKVLKLTIIYVMYVIL